MESLRTTGSAGPDQPLNSCLFTNPFANPFASCGDAAFAASAASAAAAIVVGSRCSAAALGSCGCSGLPRGVWAGVDPTVDFFSNNIGASIITYTILGVPYYNYTATALVKKQLIFPEGGLDFLFLKHAFF